MNQSGSLLKDLQAKKFEATISPSRSKKWYQIF